MSTVPMRRSVRLTVLLWVGLPVMAYVGVLAAINLGPAVRAAQGQGTPGIFTGVREQCGRGSCTLFGDWVASDGRRTRVNVRLHGGPDSLGVGDSAPAFDTGDSDGVFANERDRRYVVLIAGMTLLGAAAAVGWIVFLVRTLHGRLVRKETVQGAITRR
jgi:hypothetical protein